MVVKNESVAKWIFLNALLADAAYGNITQYMDQNLSPSLADCIGGFLKV